jgi:hypothetical protein
LLLVGRRQVDLPERRIALIEKRKRHRRRFHAGSGIEDDLRRETPVDDDRVARDDLAGRGRLRGYDPRQGRRGLSARILLGRGADDAGDGKHDQRTAVGEIDRTLHNATFM